MELVKQGKFYVIILEQLVKTKQSKKAKQKYWNNRRWRFNKIKCNKKY